MAEQVELWLVMWRQRNTGEWKAIQLCGDIESARRVASHPALTLPANQFREADKTHICRLVGEVVE